MPRKSTFVLSACVSGIVSLRSWYMLITNYSIFWCCCVSKEEESSVFETSFQLRYLSCCFWTNVATSEYVFLKSVLNMSHSGGSAVMYWHLLWSVNVLVSVNKEYDFWLIYEFVNASFIRYFIIIQISYQVKVSIECLLRINIYQYVEILIRFIASNDRSNYSAFIRCELMLTTKIKIGHWI